MIISNALADTISKKCRWNTNCFYLNSFISLFADPENVSVCSFAFIF